MAEKVETPVTGTLPPDAVRLEPVFRWTCPKCGQVNIAELSEESLKPGDPLRTELVEEMIEEMDEDEEDEDEDDEEAEMIEAATVAAIAATDADPEVEVVDVRPPAEVICDGCATVFFAHRGELDD